MKIVFFGTPGFAAAILKAIVHHGVQVVGIVTKPDTAKGRSSKLIAPEVKLEAERLGLRVPIFQPLKCSTDEMTSALKDLGADLFVVVAFGEIISQKILDIPPLGCINIHGSLLPKYRGAAPMQRALIQGEKETGITIIRMVKKMDAGDMLATSRVPIDLNMTLGELEEQMITAAEKCLIESLKAIADGSVKDVPQDEMQVTFAPKIDPAECLIDWQKPALVIHNQIRGLSPHPGAFCYIIVRGEKKRMKILRSEVVSQECMHPKTIMQSKATLDIACLEGVIRLLSVQLEGRPVMTAAQFIAGNPLSQIALA